MLDNLIQQMNDRFGSTRMIVAKLIYLVPTVITTLTDLSYEDATSFFAACLVLLWFPLKCAGGDRSGAR